MPDFRDPFERATQHLHRLGITANLQCGGPVSKQMLKKAAKGLGCELPDMLVQLYLQLGDGLSFSWHAGKPIRPSKSQLKAWDKLKKLTGTDIELPPDYDEKAFANFEIPTLAGLVEQNTPRRRWPDEPHFPHAKNQSLAKRTYARMEHWLGIHNEGKGDRICIDLADPGGAVVFDQHDWFDGGGGGQRGADGQEPLRLSRRLVRCMLCFPQFLMVAERPGTRRRPME